jgi:MFS family permease
MLAAGALGLALVGAAALPTEVTVALALVPVGALAVFFGSTASAHMQMCSAHEFRGRVMAIYSVLTLGTTVFGGPFVGWVCQRWSPRVALGLAGLATVTTAAVLAVVLRRDPVIDGKIPAAEPAQPAIDFAG